ncbi:MAG: CDGSH iron-sulfur domain-containing protein [Candidatus Odinarchaeota archaeon]
MAEKNKQNPMVVFTRWNPYLVIGAPKLTNSKGKEIPLDNVSALCRCGASSAKPFCDGSHSKVGFSGEKEPDRKEDKTIEYAGTNITIIDNSGVCSSSSKCTDNVPEVFKSGQKPWIHPDGTDDIRKLVKAIEQCPSGALSYKIGTQRIQDLDREPVIKVAKNGPLEFVGYIELIDDMNSQPESKEHYTLCRCGASKNKPFCDARHKKAGFKDEEN